MILHSSDKARAVTLDTITDNKASFPISSTSGWPIEPDCPLMLNPLCTAGYSPHPLFGGALFP